MELKRMVLEYNKNMHSHLHKKAKDKKGIKGMVTVTTYEVLPTCPRALEIDRILSNAVGMAKESFEGYIAELRALCAIRTVVKKNRVVLVSRNEMIKRLAGQAATSGVINYGALGSSATAVSDVQTALVAEVARKQYAARTVTDDQLTIDFYFSKADTNGTYNEFGMFIDGTAAANSGLMFNRVLTGSWIKTALESMTVTIQITLNAV